MRVSLETSCPWLSSRWDRDVRGVHPSEENACYLWDECGVPPDVVEYCAGMLPWHGERFVPVPVETQWSVCLTEHYGSCRWLRERQWYKREQMLVCPLLGAQHDRQHKNLFPSVLNHCHAPKSDEQPERQGTLVSVVGLLGRGSLRWIRPKWKSVPPETQRGICLTNRFVECDRYRDSLPDR